MRPGEGYFFRRVGQGSVNIRFFDAAADNAPKRAAINAESNQREAINAFSNPNAATNMTMIAKVNGANDANGANGVLKVFVSDALAAVAEPVNSLYFLTIQSDRVGELRFEMNGETLTPISSEAINAEGSNRAAIRYEADSHHGSMTAPIILRKDDNRPYKIIENDHVVIIRNNEKYDVTGKKL